MFLEVKGKLFYFFFCVVQSWILVVYGTSQNLHCPSYSLHARKLRSSVTAFVHEGFTSRYLNLVRNYHGIYFHKSVNRVAVFTSLENEENKMINNNNNNDNNDNIPPNFDDKDINEFEAITAELRSKFDQRNQKKFLQQLFQAANEEEDENESEALGSKDNLDKNYHTSKSKDNDKNHIGIKQKKSWARSTYSISRGCVLIGNPKYFLNPFTCAEMMEKFGIPFELGLSETTGNPLSENINPDVLAQYLPVVLLLGHGPSGTMGLLLNRRSGYLMGDLNLDSSGFKIQPLMVGGISDDINVVEEKNDDENRDESEESFASLGHNNRANNNKKGGGLLMLHTYPNIQGAQQVTAEGLCFGGSYQEAQEFVSKGEASSFCFNFFVQQTKWKKGDLRKEISGGENSMWFPAEISNDLILKTRGRGMKGKPSKPMWTEIMELMGGEFLKIKKKLYREEDDQHGEGED